MLNFDEIRKWVQSEPPPIIMHLYNDGDDASSSLPIINWDILNNLITVDHSYNKYNMLTIMSKLPPQSPREQTRSPVPHQLQEAHRAKVLDCTISIIVIIISCLIIAYLFNFAIEAVLISITLATFGISVALDEFLKVTTIKNSSIPFGKIYDTVITISVNKLKNIELTISLHNGISLNRMINFIELLAFWEDLFKSLKEMNLSIESTESLCISIAIDILCKHFDMKAVKLMTLKQKKMMLFIFAYSTLFIEEIEIDKLHLYDDDNTYYIHWSRYITQ